MERCVEVLVTARPRAHADRRRWPRWPGFLLGHVGHLRWDSYWSPEEVWRSAMLPPVDKSRRPFVCFPCRKSFKRSVNLESPPCPDCAGPTVGLSRKFHAPPMRDVKSWRVVEFVVANGLRYHAIRRDTGRWVSYPRTMAQAEEFVVRYRSHRVDRAP